MLRAGAAEEVAARVLVTTSCLCFEPVGAYSTVGGKRFVCTSLLQALRSFPVPVFAQPTLPPPPLAGWRLQRACCAGECGRREAVAHTGRQAESRWCYFFMADRNREAHAALPASSARSSGVWPPSSLACASAPILRSRRTTSSRPSQAAQCRGV